MNDLDHISSATSWLGERLGNLPGDTGLQPYETWWRQEGQALSRAVDQAGTPWLRMFDRRGARVDEICMPAGYRELLLRGYREGIVARVFETGSLLPFYRLGYVAAFHDAGLLCPYTLSLATAVMLDKYGTDDLKQRLLPSLLRRDDSVWQGATWFTEVGGGSDLGATVETSAVNKGSHWLLTGDKFFASNADAELALVAARPDGAPRDVHGLALFLVPRRGRAGGLNYRIRRIKDKIATRSVPTGEVELRNSEAWLLGDVDRGIYLIMEVLNISRVANSIAAVALAQRAIAEAALFAGQRRAFGRPVIQQPLMERQFQDRARELKATTALAVTAVQMLEAVWRQTRPYSDEYQLFRLVAHLAKYRTAEFAVQTCKWSMEVHGGLGVVAEHPVERWLREAMILAIWEGTAHRQILDGLEVIQRFSSHRQLFDRLRSTADRQALADIEARVVRHLALPNDAQEAEAEPLFTALARFAAHTLASGEAG